MVNHHDQFDNLLTQLGTGKWNFLFFILSGYRYFWDPPQSYNAALMTPQLNYTCLIPKRNNSFEVMPNQCSYSVNRSNGSQLFSCSTWMFDNSTFSSTMTSEFNLVCSDGVLRAYYTSVQMAGSFFGFPILGILGDKIGRKKVVMGTSLLFSISGMIKCFLTSFNGILVARFVMGFVDFPACFILAMEVCEPKWRGTVGIFLALPWAFGVMMLGIFGYIIRDWRNLQLAMSLPLLILIPLAWILDESPRWLIVNGRHDEALKVLKRAARLNKSTLPSEPELRTIMKQIQNKETEGKGDTRCGIIKFLEGATILCSKWFIIKIFLILFIHYFVASLVFYGLSLNGSSYSEDPYMYLILSGLMEAPAYSISAPIINRFGRRAPVAIGYFICGVTLLSIYFVPPDVGWLVMLLALVGKLGISASYQIVEVYSTELLPTVIRQQGFGFVALGSCIGSLISPFIIEVLGPYVSWGPSAVFGVSSLLAGVLSFALHETNNEKLPDTIGELEEIINSKKKVSKHGSHSYVKLA